MNENDDEKRARRHGGIDAGDRAHLHATRDIVAGDVHYHQTAPPTPQSSPLAVDLDGYLTRLLSRVEFIQLIGIARNDRRSQDARRYPIEQLYTPLRAMDDRRGDPRELRHAGGRVHLSALLPRHRRLLIEGEPGSGKTTFLHFVASMLARDRVRPRAKGPTWREEHLDLDTTKPAPIPGYVKLAGLVDVFKEHNTADDKRNDDHRWILELLARSCDPRKSRSAPISPDALGAHCDEWDRWLRNGDVLLLLDGLDEIADLEMRDRVFHVFRDACDRWSKAQIVVTSRPFRTADLVQLGFARTVIEPFGPGEIERFVDQWTLALHGGRTEEGEERRETLLAAIRDRAELRRLAQNPVMLTSLCVIQWNGGQLPRGKARVYRAVYDWMLAAKSKVRTGHGFRTGFAEIALPRLALAMLRAPEGKLKAIDLWDAAKAVDVDMLDYFPELGDDARRRKARAWLLGECEWSHMIREVRDRQLEFWHLTMQEFLAALQISTGDDWWDVVCDRLDDPQWREVIDFLPGCLRESGPTRVHRLMERVLDLAKRPGDLASEARVVGIVGRLLTPMDAYDYELKASLARRYEAMRVRVMEIFTVEGAARVPLQVRIEAAEALGSAGDPRLQGDNFIAVPGTAVKLGKYPVTVEEYQRFVEDADGYAERQFWDEEGWAWREKIERTEPDYWEAQAEQSNWPVTGVAWFEARAYCRWRSEVLRAEVRLPTVAEWERAAAPDGRTYPWGEPEPDATRANFEWEEDDIPRVGHPTPVGLFPAGVGPRGHLDLAGNTWEWCEDGPPEALDRRWVKGGSCWNESGGTLAAASRWRCRGQCVDDLGFRVVLAASPLGP